MKDFMFLPRLRGWQLLLSFMIVCIILFLQSCTIEKPPKERTVFASGGIRVTIDDMVNYKTLYVYNYGKLIFNYHENQLALKGDSSFVIDENSGSIDYSFDKMYVQYKDSLLLVIHFFNISKLANIRTDKYFFINIKNNKVISSFIGKRLKFAGGIFSTNNSYSDHFKNTYVDETAEGILERDNMAFDYKVACSDFPIWDYDGNSIINTIDGKLIHLSQVELTDSEKEIILKCFGGDKKNFFLTLPEDTGYQIPACRDLCNLVQERYHCSTETAASIISKFDADNSLTIGWADDINLDKKLSVADFNTERKLYDYCKKSIISPNPNYICINDVIFGLNKVCGAFQENMRGENAVFNLDGYKVIFEKSGRISVFDPSRKIQIYFDGTGKFQMAINTATKSIEENPQVVAKLKEPFKKSLDKIAKEKLWQLNKIVTNLHNFEPKQDLGNQSVMLMWVLGK